jgi:CheY-like chemotaxis protein
MSFPLNLQPLVIEDDEGAKDAYKEIFDTLRGEHGDLPFCAAPPCFAFSYEEAIACLEGSKIFHVVILDLRLPERPKLPPLDGVDLGLNLLTRCVDRDRYPIPALLVISGHIGSTEQARMQETLRNGFYYGRQLVKGDLGLLGGEIRLACSNAIRYCSVGIHLRDAGAELYPTITPREDDLLRRSALQQQGGIGLDLNWWSAKRSPELSSSGDAMVNPWTKVLMGRYLLDGGRGASRPKFFKMMAGPDAQFVIQSARHLEHKLTHVKLTSTVTSNSTALIVTEKVGAQDARPRSLEEFFMRASPQQAYEVACQITNQVRQLGDVLAESKSLKSMLWTSHDTVLLGEQWTRFEKEIQELLGSDVNPVALVSDLVNCADKVRIKEMSVVHGDLHISNIALDTTEQNAEAYIFDAGVTKQNVAGRDFAVLEVSVILHQRIDFSTIVQLCAILYDSSNPLDQDSVAVIEDPIGKCTVEFIRGLRDGATMWNDQDVYALMVLDFTVIQVEGLAFGSSGNRIWDQRSAAYLLAIVAQWYQKLRKPSAQK